MVQSKEDAEDLIQDTFLSWLSTDLEKIKNHKAYLVQSVKNACIDYLSKLKKERDLRIEHLSGLAAETQMNISILVKDLEQDLRTKLAEMMRKLNSKEQAIFFLRDTFKFSYEEVSEMTGTRLENSRKIFQRAKERMQSDKTRFSLNKQEYENNFPAFFRANILGHISEYISQLKDKF